MSRRRVSKSKNAKTYEEDLTLFEYFEGSIG